MKRFLRIAKTEILEHRRQPWMIFILALTYVLLIAGLGAATVFYTRVAGSPDELARARDSLFTATGMELDAALRIGIKFYSTGMFGNLSVFVAINSAISVLHDREAGTMPFLMLAPVTRAQLLVGKLAGAMGIPLVFHVVFVGGGALLFGRIAVLAPFSGNFGGSPTWWVAFVIGAPAAAIFLGALGTLISALSRDFRTSTQYVNFILSFLGAGVGAVLADPTGAGADLQALFAGGSLLASMAMLFLGARLISRDVTA
jgi:ABC-type transport system involved in multi-copper enzyme maturation permease subunit